MRKGVRNRGLGSTPTWVNVRTGMKVRIILALLAAVVVVGCGDAKRERAAEAPEIQAKPARDLVARVNDLRFEPAAGGAIIHAIGLPPRQGYYGGNLVPATEENVRDGALHYEFRVTAPRKETPVGTRRSREVMAARFIPKQMLEGVARIRVISSENALSVRP